MNFIRKNQKWYTLPQGAEYLSISTYKLRKALMSGEIRSKRCSDSPRSHFRFTKEWLLEYQRTMKSPSFWKKLIYWLPGYTWGQTS